jgi:hypothetical protein
MCLVSGVAFAQDRITPILPDYIIYQGVRYPGNTTFDQRSSGIVYNNTGAPLTGFAPVTPDWRTSALEDISFTPGPASGVGVSITQVVTGFIVDTVPAGGFDLALTFFDNMAPASTPVNTTPIGATVIGHFNISAAGGYAGTIGLPGIAVPDDTANGMGWAAYQTGTTTAQSGVRFLLALGAAAPGAPPTVGGSAAGIWVDQNQDGVFGSTEAVVATGYTTSSNLYLQLTGTYTPTALGGCCRADGTCTDNQTSAQCATLGGVWAGANIACAGANCPAPGACCKSAGTCISTTQPLCIAQAGVFGGVGVTCSNSCSHQYFEDDGLGEVNAGPGTATGSCAWLNQFTVANNLGTITTIDVAFGDIAVGNLNGTPVTVYLWSDPNGDGNPADAVVLASAAGVVSNSDTDTFNSFPIPPTNVGPNGTNFFVGAIINNATPTQPGLYPARQDNSTNQGKSWILTNATGAVIGPGALAGIAAAGGNFLIRADPAAAAVCYPNCDHSTVNPVLNVADFTCFLQKYAAGDPYANCDNSTVNPVLNVADFTCFLQKYAAGCSAP